MTTTLWKQKVDATDTINKVIRFSKTEDLNIHLKEEKFLEHTSSVKQLAQLLTKDEKTPIDKISKIFSYVKDSFSYEYPVKKRGVANLNFSKLSGDCAEYAGLFVSLCRAVNIPAKNITGYVLNEDIGKPNEHGWASVYIDTIGWVDLDPQYASIEPTQNYFLETPDYRLAFVHGFNIPLTPQLPNDYSFQFWIEQGLPVEHASAQTLQPLVFASKSNVQYTHKILTSF